MIGLLKCLWFLCSLMVAAFGQRSCRNELVDRASVVTSSLHYVDIVQSENGTNLTLNLVVSWEITAPENLEFDGFLITLHHNSNMTLILSPSDQCNPGKDFWVNTDNSSVCTTYSPQSCRASGGNVTNCLCKFKTCGLTTGEDRCRGTNYWLENGFISIQQHRRNLTFEIEFEKNYQLIIRPYYREFVTLKRFSLTIDDVEDCYDLVRQRNNVSDVEATQLCCDVGAPQRRSRDISVQDVAPDFRRETVSANITWLPPVTRDGFLTTRIFFYSTTHEAGSAFAGVPSLVERDRGDVESAACDNFTFYYRAEVFDLQPGVEYTVEIVSVYSPPCATNSLCTSLLRFTPVVDSCRPQWQYCDANASCQSNVTSLHATCSCKEGFEGNGHTNVSDVLGTGCSDIDYCVSALTRCRPSAICTDNAAPEPGAVCSCPSHMFGDGHMDRSDCTPISTLALGIAVPIVVLLIIFLAWRFRIRRIRQNELTWSKFVANKSLIVENYMTELQYDNEGKCLPTFGGKWEIERRNIEVGDVLGRGNYGIVHVGYYDTEIDGKVMNIKVAVKTMKEGAEGKDRLIGFLSEISFMLNVGFHPNILQVIGCCTLEQPVMLVTEYLKYGDLKQFLINAREPGNCQLDPVYHVTEKSLYQMSRQVAQGMDYLTKSRIIHGDLAARNILVGEDLVCKISDFGLANDVYRYGVIQGQSERCVPFKWISPERMMAGKVPITSKSDVWSFGNLMYEMVTLGCMPHPDVESGDLLDQLKSGYRMKQPSTCSNEMFSIMSKCWKWRPSSRPSFTDLVALLDGALDTNVDNDYVNLADAVQKLDKSEYENVVGTKKEDVTGEEKHANDDLVIDTSLPDKPTNGDLLNGHLNNGFQCEA